MSAKPLLTKFALFAAFISISFLSKGQLVPQFTSSPSSGCAPLIVNFTDQTTGGAVDWVWSVAQAPSTTYSQFSVLQNPGYLFINPGVFSIKLVVKNAAGVSQTIIKTSYITVNASPTVNFIGTPTSGCAPLTVNFTNTSSAGSGTVVGTIYDFGDGSAVSNLPNPQHVYLQAGVYNVTLTVTNSTGCTKTVTKSNFISVNSDVISAFTTSIPSVCSAPVTATFQNQSTGAGTLSYLWNFGDPGSLANNTSTLPNPTHIYTSGGSYSVILTTTSSTGCSNTVTTNNAVVIGVVNANFTLPASVCVGQSFTITNTSAPTPTAAAWTFGAGTVPPPSNLINPTISYTIPGTYTINLVSTFGSCTAIASRTITVLPKPQSLFTGAPLAACKPPLTVNFSSNSSINAVSYEWHFGDGSPISTLANPSHTYTTAGTFTDTLIVTSANGCTDTLIKQDHIKIQAPTATINNLPKQGCAPLTWTFASTINSVVPITGYEWFSNGVLFSTNTTPTQTFPVGNYDIKLVITSLGGCTDTVIVTNGIIAALKPVANFVATPPIACAFSDVIFQSLSTGTIDAWDWEFGDLSHQYIENPTHAYNDTGFFSVTLIVSNNGCRDTLRLQDYIYINPPIASFTPIGDCINKFKRIFTDNSIGADTYLWDFGEVGSPTNTSTIANPEHTYSTVGPYTVKLTVSNSTTGCIHTKIAVVTIANEQAAFDASLLQMCKGASTTFTATSPFTPNYITNYAWTFGDGGVGTGNPITHQYDSASNFNVKLLITDINGCKDSLTRNSFVNVFGPKSNFAPSVPGACLLSNITFNDLSITDGIHPITEWTWNYGEGIPQTYTTPPFTHSYPNPGLFAVTLTVKDSYGCTSTLTKPNLLTISQPVSDFLTPNTPSCPNAPIVFTSTSVGTGLTYFWEFGDNNTSILANPTHFYLQDGIYTIKLTVTDIYGCTDVETKVAYVRILTPVANFTVNQTITTCPPLVGMFTNTSINASLYEWDFGNGFYIPIANLTPSFTFNTPGIFVVKLRVTGAGGCTSIKTETITIRGPIGSFDYNPKNGCNPLLVNFIATTPDIVSIVNDYNDGFLSAPTTNLTASHTYTVPGMYIPKMILTDASGCTVAITGTDTIKVRGVAASFVADTLLRCNSGVVNFSNTSISNELITGYEWNFGDGPITSPEVSPSHVYTGTGIYTPSLTVTTQSGCVNQFAAPVPIKVVKTPEISIAQPINKCVPALMSFNGILLNADTSSINWQWVFNNGAIDTIRANGLNLNNISFPNAGIYAGTLLASNSSGCKDTAFTSLEIYPKPIVDAGADLLICKGTGQTLTATGGVSYIWSPSIGLSCTNCPNPIANPDSVKNYVVSGTSTLGCVNTDTVKVSVQYPFNMPDGNNGQLCIGKSKILTASGALTYDWSPSIGLNKVTGPVVTATPSVTTNYMVIGKDGKNCFSDTAYYFVKVFPIPTVSTSGDRTINIGQSITVTASVSSDVTTAIWTPPTGIVSTSFPSVTVKPNVDQQYKVIVSNAGGCTAEALVNVFVICDGANVFIPNTFSPNGDGNNEVFYPRGTGLFRIKNIKIFNRWGEQVFERYNFKANNESDGWDGTFKGQKLMPDVYVYIMDIQCENNSILTYKGNVALIK